MLISLFVATMLVGGHDPDGVVSTAPKGDGSVLVGAVTPTAPDVTSVSGQEITPHGLSTDEQIDRWISQRAEADKPFAGDRGPWVEDDRKMHSEFSAAIGTGDFSAYSAAVSIPIGENGRLNLSYSQSKNDHGYGGYGYGYDGYGYGPGGFGPGGFGATGRYGYGYGAPSIFPRGVVYPGRSFSPTWQDERPVGERKAEQDRSRVTAED